MSKSETEILKKDEILSALENDLGHKNFILDKVTVNSASESPLGLLGDHLKMRVVVTVSGRRQDRQYFVKTVPTKVADHARYAYETKAFFKEAEIYKTLFVDLKNAQAKAKKPRTRWHPECYYIRGEDILVMEDLTFKEYYMYPDRCLMDEDHIRAGIRAMAAMHSASIIFEEKLNRGEINTIYMPEKFNSKKGKLTLGEIYSHLTFETEFSGEKGHIGNTFLEAGIASQCKLVELMKEFSPDEKKIIVEKLPGTLRRIFDLVKPSNRFKNVFIHGDLWANNLLFRKDKEGKVNESIIVDYQMARYAPPAHDLLLFLYLVQDKEFLDAKSRELIMYYYEFFSKELEKNSLNASDLFPWEKFLESCEFYTELGLLARLFYFQVTLAPSDVLTKVLFDPEMYKQNMLVDRTEMVVDCFLNDVFLNKRLTGAITEVAKKLIL